MLSPSVYYRNPRHPPHIVGVPWSCCTHYSCPMPTLPSTHYRFPTLTPNILQVAQAYPQHTIGVPCPPSTLFSVVLVHCLTWKEISFFFLLFFLPFCNSVLNRYYMKQFKLSWVGLSVQPRMASSLQPSSYLYFYSLVIVDTSHNNQLFLFPLLPFGSFLLLLSPPLPFPQFLSSLLPSHSSSAFSFPPLLSPLHYPLFPLLSSKTYTKEISTLPQLKLYCISWSHSHDVE